MTRVLSLLLVTAFAFGSLSVAPTFADEKEDAEKAKKVEARKKKMFKKLDTSKDSKLSEEEYVASAKNDEAKPKKAKAFKKLDANKDGFVTLEEFLKPPTKKKKKKKDDK